MAKANARKTGTLNQIKQSVGGTFSKTSSGGRKSSRGGAGQFMTDMWSRPVSKYVAGGLGVLVLSKIIMKVYNTYPAISEFIQENLDTVEAKLSEVKDNFSGDQSMEDEESMNA